ncbi:MAG: hypothetical protein R2799_05830 [Crocinitomicaceae bacterium]
MKKVKTILFVALTSFAIASCGGEEKKDEKKDEKKTEAKTDEGSEDHSSTAKWDQSQQDQFMKTCVEGVKSNPQINGEEYCSCMLDKVMEKYPNPANALNMDKSWMQAEAVKCLGM